MKRKIMVTALPIIILASVFAMVYFLSIKETSAEVKHITKEELIFMTEEEIIKVFYDNFDAFDDVMRYVLSEERYLGIGLDDSKIYTHDNTGSMEIDNLEFDSLEVGEQLKLLREVGFDSIRNEPSYSAVYFYISHASGTQGIVYLEKTVKDDKYGTPLEIENWHYFILFQES